MASQDPTKRFSDRVDNYRKYRPSYPDAFLDAVSRRLNPGDPIADVGGGTGILSALLLSRGYDVYLVEPNDEMRAAAVADCSSYPHFRPVASAAEKIDLPDNSVSMSCCAQSFHWFANEQAVSELKRITRPSGFICLVWNMRMSDADPFSIAYEELMYRYAIDYASVGHRSFSAEDIARLFAGSEMRSETYEIHQNFDWEGVWGRIQSASYAPAKGHENYEPLRTEMRKRFERFAVDGRILFFYKTESCFISVS